MKGGGSWDDPAYLLLCVIGVTLGHFLADRGEEQSECRLISESEWSSGKVGMADRASTGQVFNASNMSRRREEATVQDTVTKRSSQLPANPHYYGVNGLRRPSHKLQKKTNL